MTKKRNLVRRLRELERLSGSINSHEVEKQKQENERPKIIYNINDYGNVDVNGLIKKLSNRIKELEEENKYLKSQLDWEKNARRYDYDDVVFNGCV